MTIKQLSHYLLDEELCEKYLCELGILKTFSSCPACNSTHFDRVRRQRFMCYECRYEWNIRRNSFLQGKHLDLSVFIACLKFFSDDVPAHKCAAELEISPDTVNNLYRELRAVIVGVPILNGDEGKQLIVYIRIIDRMIDVCVNSPEESSEFAQLCLTRSIDKNKAFMYMLDYKNFRLKSFLNRIARIDGLDEFYRYCQERLLNYRGRDTTHLFSKLRELTFRYNHRGHNLYDMLIQKLSV